MNYRVRVLLLALLVYWLQVLPVFSQIGINATGNNPHSSAMLDVAADGATKGGLLIPRMTTAERNSISNPANSLLIFNTTTQCFEAYNANTSTWVAFGCIDCQLPGAFSASAATNITATAFNANWTASAGATTYYLDVNTNSSFTGTWILNNQNVGNVTSYVVSGLVCNTTYYYRVRAANSCGTSANSNVISVTTAACPPPSCGTQVWMAANMDVGTRVNGSAGQNNDSQVEKYCYNDQDANCTTYGGLYQWAEAIQAPHSANSSNYTGSWATCDPCGSGGRQGICPAGYHIPTDREWSRYEWCVENSIAPTGTTPLSTFQSNTGWRGTNDNTIGPGAKLKASSSNTPSWDGTNASGFTALPAGYRYGGAFYNLGSYAFFWSATELFASSAWCRDLLTGSWQSYRTNPYKSDGLSVRCLQN